MRIALVTPEYPDCGPSYGIGRYLQVLVDGLVARGHRTLVLVISERGCFRGEDGATPQRLGPSAGVGLLRPLLAHGWIERQVGTWGAELMEYSNWGGLGAWLRVPCPSLCRLSTSIARSPSTGGRRRALRHLHLYQEHRSVRRATLVLADSQSAALMGARLYGRHVDGVVFHGLAPALVTPPTAPRRDVIYLGRLEHRKGIDHLLRAWPSIYRSAPQAKLHVVGSDPHGLAGRIHHPGLVFHGRLEDPAVAALKQHCLVQVVPSRFESFGLVVLEAWRDGLAVVANDAAALSELVPGGGLLVDAARPAQLAEAVSDLLLEPATAQHLAAAGARLLVQRFAADRFIDRSLRWYRQCRQA